MRLQSLPLLLAMSMASASPPKVLLIYDMEGISAVNQPSMVLKGFQGYDTGRSALASDVQAVVRGLKRGGAGTIWIVDGHGSGNTVEPDLSPASIDVSSHFAYRPHPFDPYFAAIDPSADVVVCVGMHAAANTRGFLAHTLTPGVTVRVNGKEATETHLVSISAARFGIPVILVSGDQVLEQQLRSDFPELVYIRVKEAKSLASAKPAEDAALLLEQGAERAMTRFQDGAFRSWSCAQPMVFELDFRSELAASVAACAKYCFQSGPRTVTLRPSQTGEGLPQLFEALKLGMMAERNTSLQRLLESAPQTRSTIDTFRKGWLEAWITPDHAPEWMRSPAASPPHRVTYWGAD